MAQEGLCELTDALPGGTTVAMDTEIGWNIYYSAGTCESGWHTHGASCYLFQVAAKQNWDLAQVACQNNSGHLVYIETGPEMETLTQIMTDHYPGDVRVWIGARDNGNGVFLWGDRTTLSGTFMNWDRDQPNSASENCAEINSARGYRWNDKECDAALNYICEKENV